MSEPAPREWRFYIADMIGFSENVNRGLSPVSPPRFPPCLLDAMRKTLIAAALVALSGTAHAEKWLFLTSSSHKDVATFVDAETVVKKGQTVTIWMKSILDKKAGVNSMTSKMTYFCETRELQQLYAQTYSDYTIPVKTFPNSRPKSPIVPDTVGSLDLLTICSKEFPRLVGGALYEPVTDNDTRTHAEKYFDAVR